jgi:RNA polymerase sigma factor (sigma-70 family)
MTLPERPYRGSPSCRSRARARRLRTALSLRRRLWRAICHGSATCTRRCSINAAAPRPSPPREPSKAAEAPVSLNQPVGSDEEGEFGDLFKDSNAGDPAEEAMSAVERQEIRRAVSRLTERERRLIELRFGFDGEPASLERISKELGLSRERVRRLEEDAFERLASELDLAQAA